MDADTSLSSHAENFTHFSLAKSCKEIYNANPYSESDYILLDKAIIRICSFRVYCKMDANSTCTDFTGGWMRVAYLDMRNSSHQCPSGMALLPRSSNPKRVCDLSMSVNRPSRHSCPSHLFSVHGLSHKHVYGRIIAYQNGYTHAFHYASHGIDKAYVFGVSLTHGQNPRKHIWTFAGADDETSENPRFKCPCINRNISPSSTNLPSFIGNDYFCDTARSTFYNKDYNPGTFYPDDILWDGKGCGLNMLDALLQIFVLTVHHGLSSIYHHLPKIAWR